LRQDNNKNIALLIDADNSPSTFIQEILTELASYGKVNIRRAYGNWASTNLKSWATIIQDYAIQPIQQYDLTKGKNATDIALTIDALDILYTKDIDAFGTNLAVSVGEYFSTMLDQSMNWDDAEKLCSQWNGQFALKVS
jgi:isopentenyl diphosphate isomerase/L-lactate dehydrogenase-like FMN-dependent dehydrogenase